MTDTPSVPPFNPFAPEEEVFGGYQIKGELGRGGMGVVYRAFQPSLKRTVALKMLTGRFGKNDIARFIAEAQTAAALQHTNIVHIYEVGEQDGAPFFAMEFVEGGTLSARLALGAMPPAEAAAMMLTLARAVHFAHSHGVVHRDLKPSNVLLDQDGVPKIADFGIAKRLDAGSDDDSMATMSGAIMGTPSYMAPEQASGSSHKAGPPSDVYSLGAMLYELLTGRPPFVAHESETPMPLRVIGEDPVSPAFHRPQIPRDLEAICMMCLQKDPRDRFASADALADDLQRFLSDEPIRARPPSRLRRTMKWVKRHPWLVTAYSAVLLVVGAGLHSLWQWEMYERPHQEYAATIGMRHGGIEGVGALTDEEAKRNGICVRLTRRGRRGPIVKAEIVNPKGRPANPRDLLDYDFLPTFLDGAVGWQTENSKGRESVCMEVSYVGDKPYSVTGRDRNGRVTVNIQYNEEPGANRGVATFNNAGNYDYSMPSGASKAAYQRDDAGREIRVEFRNSKGDPARNGEGVFGYLFTRNSSGRVEALVNIDQAGQPMANVGGLTRFRFEFDERGDLSRAFFQRAKAESAPFDGAVAVRLTHDGARNLTSRCMLDANGKQINGPEGWASKDLAHDDAGQITEIRLRAADGAPVTTLKIGYDDHGFPADRRFFSSDGAETTHRIRRYDERGNVLEDKVLTGNTLESWTRHELDEWGHRVLTETLDQEGKALTRTTRVYRNDDLVSEAYEDADHQPRGVGSGYTRLDCRYHALGYCNEEVYSGFKDSPLVMKITKDEFGRALSEVWLDADKHPVSGLQGWAWRKFEYAPDGQALLGEKYTDAAESRPVRNVDGFSSVRYFHDSAGLLEAKEFSGYDGSQGYAIKRESFDSRGRHVGECYFDANGKKAWCRDGYHCQRDGDVDRDSFELILEDFDPSRFAYFRNRTRSTIRNGKVIRTVTGFEDDGGRPVTPNGFSGLERDFDDQGREVAKVETGWSVETWGAPIWRTETEWGEGRIPRRRVEQALDPERRPLTELTIIGPARTEETFGGDGKLLERIQSGFPGRVTGFTSTEEALGGDGKPRQRIMKGFAEQTFGYASIEVAFTPKGALEGVTHRRGDGTVVDVRVVIMEIAPEAQEKAADLRVGDVLVSANGDPVTSAFAFGFTGPFSGGYLEVERDGKRLRIDGFKAGKIGFMLNDRAR